MGKKIDDISMMNKSELIKAVNSTKKELFSLRMKLKTGQLTPTHELKINKKIIARLKTQLNILNRSGEER